MADYTYQDVLDRLNYGLYVHTKVTSKRQLSKAWDTINKIIDAKSLKEISDWFYCTECKDILTKNISKGTGPLLTHQKKHAEERAKKESLRQAVAVSGSANTRNDLPSDIPPVKLPEPIESMLSKVPRIVSQQQTEKTEKTEKIENVVENSLHKNSEHEPQQMDSSTQTDQDVGFHKIGVDELPMVLEDLGKILSQTGNAPKAADYKKILPVGGKWYVFFFVSF